jgi:hypothetical protein
MTAPASCQLRAAAALLAVLVVLPASLRAQARAPGPLGAERVLFEAANRERAERKLPALRWDDALARAAREHAALMARVGAISHQFPGEPGLSQRVTQAGVRFTLVAENVGEAPDVDELHSLWMKSPGHRANLLEPRSNAAGIAVVRRKGQYFGVQDFARILPTLSIEEQEKEVGSLLAARGLQLLPDHRGARETCAISHGLSPGVHPHFMFRYLTEDIRRLPPELEDELRQGNYHSAAVGACSVENGNDSAGYRVAVLLY